MQLKPNWDGYGAPPLSQRRVLGVLQVWASLREGLDLPTPSVAPTVDGSIQIEWDRHGIAIEFTVGDDLAINFYAEDALTRTSTEREGTKDLLALRAWLETLASREKQMAWAPTA